MATAKKAAGLSDQFALYEKLVAINPKVELKGDANGYTSLNGNMFT